MEFSLKFTEDASDRRGGLRRGTRRVPESGTIRKGGTSTEKTGNTRKKAQREKSGTREKTRKAAAPPAPDARRLPSQDRGQRRYSALLAAAEAVIAEVGVDAATTNAIAARAGSGMGSLYRFFPNKEAIIAALAERYDNEILALTQYALRPDLAEISLAAMVDEIVDPLAEFFRRSPAYRHVFQAIEDPNFDGGRGCKLPETIVRHVESVIASRAAWVGPKERHVHAMVSVELVHRMLSFAFQQPPSQRKAVILETKRLLALYSEMIVRKDDPLRRLR